MSSNPKVQAAINRAYALTDTIIQNTSEKRHEFRKQTILADESLTKDEKSEAIKISTKELDYYKLLYNKGTKRICENCQDECLATLFCEHCVRNYLKANFSYWTSGNNDIDNLIQKCQMKTIHPFKIVEWIPYNRLQNIKYLTKGGCSEIYTANWIDGYYIEWDSKEKKLKRYGDQIVVLKRLENVESANRSWLEEGKTHLTLSTRYGEIVPCFGLTKDPSDGNYMLVMNIMHQNLREYLQQNHNKLTWKEGIQIAYEIAVALLNIHKENEIHRDLHSGNMLFHQIEQRFRISDLGFCGPADKPLNSIYGNLPYIAPEVINGKETTFASDVYSIGMLMWEISSGQPPFAGIDQDYDLAMKIINGNRPKVIPETPLEYNKLIEQCWDADPTKRSDIRYLCNKIGEIRRSYQNENTNHQINNSTIIYNTQLNTTSFSSTSFLVRNFSKIHIFENLPEPRNATEEEQQAYHSLQSDLCIPDNNDNNEVKDKPSSTSSLIRNFSTVEDLPEQRNATEEEQRVYNSVQNDLSISGDHNNKVKSQYKRINSSNSDDEREDLIVNSKKIKLSNDEETDAQYTNNVGFQYTPRNNYITSNDDDDETYNDPNLYSEVQDELEILED